MKKGQNVQKLSFFIVLASTMMFSLINANSLLSQEKVNNKLQVDPFYLKLFDEGLLAFNRGEFEEAFQSLKIAAFGLLDEPDLLGEAFVYLTVCAYNLKREDQVEYYLKEIARFKLNNRILGSRLPKTVKEQFARIQTSFKNGLPG